MFTKKDLAKYISGYIAECNKLGVHFKKIILFGSYARNTPHEWSDVNLALVSDDFTGMRLEDRDKVSPADIKFVDTELLTYISKIKCFRQLVRKLKLL